MALAYQKQVAEKVTAMMGDYQAQMAEAVNALLKDGVKLVKVANTHIDAWVVVWGDGQRTPMYADPVHALESAVEAMERAGMNPGG